MPALPKVLLSIVKCQLSIVFIFSLFTLTLTTPALAAPGDPPNPQPCKNPLTTFDLVDNYITTDEGEAPFIFEGEVVGNPGDKVTLASYTFNYTVDFSKLQSLFANTNSNFLEGETQSSQHRLQNLIGSNSEDRNEFFRAIQKTSQKVLLDVQRKNYVEYVYNKPELAESGNLFTDINGQGDPKTIYDLVNEFGLPSPPKPGEDKSEWLATWGKYWAKIPTAWSEFYEGEIAFNYFIGSDEALKKFQENKVCPPRIEPPIKFVMPEFFRTTSVSDQLNRSIVAKAAQSFQDHGILAQKPDNLISKVLAFCWESIKNSASNLKKVVVKISLEILNPIKIVNAAPETTNNSCIKPLLGGKVGQSPYCPLPTEEYTRLRQTGSVSCNNRNDPNKLEPTNPNVVCTFTITWPAREYTISESDPPSPCLSDATKRCIKVRIWPNIRIPWLAAIWNSTLYSQDDPGLANQKTGRPGVFGFFTPGNILQKSSLSPQEIIDFCNTGNNNETPLCQKLGAEFGQCVAEKGFEHYGDCLIGVLANLPGTTEEQAEIKERFIGGTDCAKEFTRDFALKPKAIQEKSIKELCKNAP